MLDKYLKIDSQQNKHWLADRWLTVKSDAGALQLKVV